MIVGMGGHPMIVGGHPMMGGGPMLAIDPFGNLIVIDPHSGLRPSESNFVMISHYFISCRKRITTKKKRITTKKRKDSREKT